jgi:mono/diheme cytochrome c family protein
VNEAAIAATERGITDHGAEGEIELAEVEPVSAEFTARGTFNVTCALCHGEAGNGEGPTGALLTPPPANFTDPEFWATRDAERIFNSIKNGAASVGGSALMVPWRNSYNDEQIRELAEYVETFRPEGS